MERPSRLKPIIEDQAMKPLRLPLAALGLALAAAGPAAAASPPVYTGFLSHTAVSGYDPVAYFTTGAPMQGSKSFTAQHNGAEYRFASAANRDAFKANPARYAPQYGGYCAWAVSQGYTAPADPKVWKIVNGKLYLNYNAEVGQKWAKDVPGYIAKGDANWPKVLG
jgi:YHS domain-containing protein